MGFSLINHPAIGVPPFSGTPQNRGNAPQAMRLARSAAFCLEHSDLSDFLIGKISMTKYPISDMFFFKTIIPLIISYNKFIVPLIWYYMVSLPYSYFGIAWTTNEAFGFHRLFQALFPWKPRGRAMAAMGHPATSHGCAFCDDENQLGSPFEDTYIHHYRDSCHN